MDSKLTETLLTGLTGGIGGGLIALGGAYWKGKADLLGQLRTQFENLPFLMGFRRAAAYEEETGKRAATHEDIDNVLREVRLVTKETERIRTEIGAVAWTRERVWEEKKAAYNKVFKSCRTLSDTLGRYLELRRSNFMYARQCGYSTQTTDTCRGPEFDIGGDFLKRILDVENEFDEASIFLGDGIDLLFAEFEHERSALMSLVSTEPQEDDAQEEAAHEKIMDGANFLLQWRGRIADFAKVDLGVKSSTTLEFKK